MPTPRIHFRTAYRLCVKTPLPVDGSDSRVRPDLIVQQESEAQLGLSGLALTSVEVKALRVTGDVGIVSARSCDGAG